MLRYVSLILILTGCAVSPDDAVAPGDRSLAYRTLDEARPPSSVDFMPLRIGVEYLPEATRNDAGSLLGAHRSSPQPAEIQEISVLSMSTATVRSETGRQPDGRREREKSPWLLTKDQLAAIEDPSERLTMQFVDDLVGEDRRRMQRELRTPVLTNRLRYSRSDSLHLPIDDLQAEEEASFLNETAPGLLRRPLRKLLKRVSFVEDMELAFKDFRGDNVPFSTEYSKKSRRGAKWGRVSMRVRLSDGSDPVELSYYNWGWRIGSSKERSRLQYRFRVADKLEGSIRYRFDYLTHDAAVRADLRYTIDDRTHLTMLLGDQLDFLAGPTAYSFLNTPLDGTAGVLFYVEHLF